MGKQRMVRQVIGTLVLCIVMGMVACSLAEVRLHDPSVGYSLQIQVMPGATPDAELIEIEDYSVPLAYAEKDDHVFEQRHILMSAVIGAMAVVYGVLLLRERRETRRLQSDLQAKEVQ